MDRGLPVRGRTEPGAHMVSDSVVARAMSERRVVASHGFSRMLLAANGASIPVAVTAAPLATDDGQITGAVAVIRDVSREREVDELKSSLVSTVSHELRTPLTMIRGFSELLLSRKDLDAKRSRRPSSTSTTRRGGSAA